MPTVLPEIAWIRTHLGSEARLGKPLTGGVTSRVRIVETNGEPAILKQVTNEAWLRERPEVIEYEATVLRHLASTPIPVPQVLAVDPSGSRAGAPSMLLSWLDGQPAGDVDPPTDWLDALAGIAADIARIEPPPWLRPFARYLEAADAQPPPWAVDRLLWQDAIDVILGPAPEAPGAFIHRDYHPWNVLWNGAVSGVVDWSQASAGPSPMDSAHCRANLAIRFGSDTAEAYGRCWEAATGLRHDAYWDLVTCVDFLPDWRPSQRGNDGLESWVRQALSGVA